MNAIGLVTAEALHRGVPGNPDIYTGWRGQLQLAADVSGQDREILSVADTVHATAAELRTAAGLHLFADVRLGRLDGPPAKELLVGILSYAVWAWAREPGSGTTPPLDVASSLVGRRRTAPGSTDAPPDADDDHIDRLGA